ncbi:conserved oligomeric Golgi complex subunit 5-like isoform X3 [Tachypleus tridentatus]|uniref:conserved oligomeric Golgi complex subunit 5-like isoform X3 n=1 Tax=Tachypleus tridentatus TaxID=6853 RepID=UPI003FD2404F
MTRLKGRVTEPYRKVENQTVMLMRLQETCDLLRRISSIFKLTLRLQNQIQGGLREITKAAQSINELVYLTEGVDLSDLEPIKKDQNFIHEARNKVEQDAEQMLEMGMESQNQTQVATALQVFHNLQVLQAKICKVVEQVKNRLKKNVNEALDIKGLITNPVSASSRGGPGRAAMPTLGNVGVFRKTLWSNMERLMDQIYVACSQVQHLQKVLAKKRDPVSHVCFLDEFSKNEERNIMVYFWSIVTNILTECFSKTAQESTHIRQAFEVEYPKLLKLYTDLWKRLQHFNSSINVVTGPDSLLQQQDSGDSAEIFTETIDADTYNPEKALRDTLTSFEKSYLSQSLSRLSDSVHKVFSGGNQDPPTQDDIEGIVKIISSEMTVASVDLVLSKNVAKTVGNIVKIFTIKCEDMITEDEEATQVIHPPTSHQHLNATIAYLLLLFESQLTEFLDGPSPPFQESAEIIRASLQSVPVLMSQAIHPLMNSVAEAIEKIILTMHKEDFSKSGQESDNNTPEPPCSLYMKELQSFIFRVKGQYFSILPVCDLVQKNIQQVACRAIDFFVRHASLVRPLGDGGRMRLAADFAQMEMAVETLCSRIGELGKSYKLLRSFRPLLFQTPAHIIKSSVVGDILPFPITLHFLFSKAPPELKSPYEVSGWSIADYSKWLDDHSSEKDQLLFIRWTLEAYVNTVKQRQGREFCSIYPIMLELLHLGLQKLEIR